MTRWLAGASCLVAVSLPSAPAAASDATTGAGVPASRPANTEASLRAITECVIVNGDGSFTAFFGYEHVGDAAIELSRGESNRVNGARASSPTIFQPGRHVAVFSATTRGERIRWRLGGTEAEATPESQPCSTNPSVPEAPVTVVLLLAPALMTGWWLRRREQLVAG